MKLLHPCASRRRPAVQVSHNRKFVVSGGEEGEVRVWEVRTREMILHLKQHTMSVTSLSIFEDDSQVISASRDRSILRWDLRLGQRNAALTQRMGGINSIVLMPDGSQVRCPTRHPTPLPDPAARPRRPTPPPDPAA